MMIDKVVGRKIKGRSFDAALSNVNLVTGENGTGKTAVLAAIQLALGTPVSGVGLAAKTLGLLGPCPGKCETAVTAGGREYTAVISNDGKRVSVLKSITDIERDAMLDQVPQTVDDFYSLSGEDAWALMMRAASKKGATSSLPHSFKDEEIDAATKEYLEWPDCVSGIQAATDALKERLRSIVKQIAECNQRLSVSPPEAKVDDIASINRQVADIKESLRMHAIAVGERDARERARKRYQEDIHAATTTRESLVKEVNLLRTEEASLSSALFALQAAKNSIAYQEWSKAIAKKKSINGISYAARVLEDLVKAGPAEIDTSALLSELTTYIKSLGRLNDKTNPDLAFFEMAKSIEEHHPKYANYKSITASAEGIDSAILFVTGKANTVKSAISAAETKIESLGMKLSTLNGQLAQSASGELAILSEESISSASAKLKELEDQQAAWGRMENYQRMQREDTKLIEDLNAKKIRFEDAIADLNQARNEIIKSVVPVVEMEANKIVIQMGLPGVTISANQTAKRTTLQIENTMGVDMRTICASHRVIYGAALLHALQVVCDVQLPVLYVEAAELDKPRLVRFIEVLSKVRTTGNAIVAHWLSPISLPPEVTVIKC